jgi:excisionase family DNA binding protein
VAGREGDPLSTCRKEDDPLDLSNRLALTIAEAARAVGVSERHLRSMLHEIPHTPMGRRVVIPVDPFRDWLRRRAEQRVNEADRAVNEILSDLDGR